MEKLAQYLMSIYGVLMLAGGVGGYAKAHSKPSLIAGIGSAVLLAVAVLLSRSQPRVGIGLGGVVAAGLAFVFVRRIQELQTQGKSIGMSIGLCALSAVVGVVLLVIAAQVRK